MTSKSVLVGVKVLLITAFGISAMSCAEDPIQSSLDLNVTPQTIQRGESVTLSWQSQNVDQCQASGDWMGSKSARGTESTSALTDDARFVLSCRDLSGASVSRTVIVSVTATGNDGGSGSGSASNGSAFDNATYSIDSHFIKAYAASTVYVFAGSLSDADVQSAANAAQQQLAVKQTGPCQWGYDAPSLSAGVYTVALSNDGLASVGALRVFNLTANINPDLSILPLPQQVLRVGPGKTYATPSAAVNAAHDGDVIEIDGSVAYTDDTLTLNHNNVSLRGVNGRPHIQYTGNAIANRKGIWVISGNQTRIENIEFSGAKVSANDGSNGAAIRFEGRDISLCEVYAHDNENGFLGHGGVVDIEYSEFNHNGLGDVGKTHNVYINESGNLAVDAGDQLIFKFNYSHRAYAGHNLKTRAQYNDIEFNRIMDEADGESSYLIDIPNGGHSVIIGNVLQQGPNRQNSTLISYGESGLKPYGGTDPHAITVYNNTAVNDSNSGNFISQVLDPTLVDIRNNLLVGSLNASGLSANNVVTNAPGFYGSGPYDYHIGAQSPARDYATSLPGTVVFGNGDTFETQPRYQYVYDMSRETRPQNGDLDAGAFEYVP